MEIGLQGRGCRADLRIDRVLRAFGDAQSASRRCGSMFDCSYRGREMTTRNEVPPVIVGSDDKGARGHRLDSETGIAGHATFYAVSKVRLDGSERVSAVVWSQIDPQCSQRATDEAVASVQDVVEALHNGDTVFAWFAADNGRRPEQRFVAIEHDDGQETIALECITGAGHQVGDMERIDD
jgi:hypothetical protein